MLVHYPEAAHAPVDPTRTDLVEEFRRNPRGPHGPELQVHGSGDLIQTLLRHRLVDELWLWTFPVLVGPGKRLFGEGTVPGGLSLVSSTVSSTGVVIGTYVPAGEIKRGSFALD